tara:strand:+ start:22222 stop:22521 length:300 start_codon:yes stop_codon:yes gene_type:complete
MSRSYPIWNKVQACIYKSDKSYGAKDQSSCEILVGSSKGNSHTLGKIETKRKTVSRLLDNGKGRSEIHFELCVNDVVIRTMIFTNNNDHAGELIKTINK